ncbi:MAG: alpha/beta hydrolase [Nevskia sp.]
MSGANATNAEPAGTAAGIELGSGPTLLLLHGLSATWRVWKPVLPLLARRFRVIALTLPGHDGGSVYEGRDDATVAGLAEQLIAQLRARGITQAHVAGNSLGGWLALELARRGYAQSVTAFSPAGGWTFDAEYRQIARPFRIFYALMPLILFLTTLFLGFAGLRKAIGKKTMEHGDRVPAEELRTAMRAMARTRILPGLLRSMGRIGSIEPMAAGAIPIRICWSECDQVIPWERYGKPLVARVAGAEAAIIPGVGHVPMHDDPDAIARHIGAVVDAAEAAAAGSERKRA